VTGYNTVLGDWRGFCFEKSRPGNPYGAWTAVSYWGFWGWLMRVMHSVCDPELPEAVSAGKLKGNRGNTDALYANSHVDLRSKGKFLHQKN
jgi:hypothetical protein